MTEPAISLAVFDPAERLFASIRSGIGVVFEGDDHRVLAEPPSLGREDRGWLAGLGGEGELRFEPASPATDVGGVRTSVCRVRGRLGGRELACLGTAAETASPPSWGDLDAVRSIVAVFTAENAVIVHARRPRGVAGHGEESIAAALLEDGELRELEEARVSTVYDGDGRQRSAGIELWPIDEDLPRRAAGEARAGMSLALEGLHVHLAMFTWRMEGREGAGVYELTVRDEVGEAA